jgi:hypothetical protein
MTPAAPATTSGYPPRPWAFGLLLAIRAVGLLLVLRALGLQLALRGAF